MFEGKLAGICIGAKAKAQIVAVNQVTAIAGGGLEGDRYAAKQVSLIEQEALEAVARDYEIEVTHAESRRNLLTVRTPLNQLVGRTFRIGSVHLRGLRLCEPCEFLESVTRPGVMRALIHRGGLRAEVLEGGTIQVDDEITLVDE